MKNKQGALAHTIYRVSTIAILRFLICAIFSTSSAGATQCVTILPDIGGQHLPKPPLVIEPHYPKLLYGNVASSMGWLGNNAEIGGSHIPPRSLYKSHRTRLYNTSRYTVMDDGGIGGVERPKVPLPTLADALCHSAHARARNSYLLTKTLSL